MYRVIILSLLYLTTSKPDAVFSMGMWESFQACSKESYLKATKTFLRYLKGIQDLVLYYPLCNSFDLIGYGNVDKVGYLFDKISAFCMVHFFDKNSAFGMDHFLGSSSLSWRTNKQNPVALSIAELCVMLCITPMDKEVT